MAKVETGSERHAPPARERSTNSQHKPPTAEPRQQQQQQQRVPPHDAHAEESLIAAALINPTALATLVARVRPDQFYVQRHKQIAEALHDLVQDGQPADAVTVHGRLSQRGIDVPLVDLMAMSAPSSSNADQYADLVLATARRRDLIALSSELAESAWAGHDPARPLQHLKLAADAVERDSAEPLEVRWVDLAVKEPPPEPPVLIDGLMRVGELMVVGAPRAVGKSWLAMNLAALLGRGDGLFLGSLPVARQARTLICQGEVDQWNTSDRWRMLTLTDGPPDGVAETFDRWRIRIVQRTLSRDGATDRWFDAVLDGRLEQTIAQNGFKVLIIDPWAVYYSGSENSNDETEAALDKLRALAMRQGLAVVIMHHTTGKGGATPDTRDPEDLWRGASRLADWASTRVTLMPHYTPQQAKKMGMTRRQARRYQDVFFLRRSTPTDDFSIVLNPQTGWWERWRAPEEAAERARIALDPHDLQDACIAAGGSWTSLRTAAESLGVAQATAKRLLSQAVLRGILEEYEAPKNGKGYRLPAARFDFSDEAIFAEDPNEPLPPEPPDED